VNYIVDSYGNTVREDVDEDADQFGWFYDLDDNSDETPRWIENTRLEKTNWWSDDTFEPLVESEVSSASDGDALDCVVL
jgi:hypothetical protein